MNDAQLLHPPPPFAVGLRIENKKGKVRSHWIKTEAVIDGRPLTLRHGVTAASNGEEHERDN